MNMQYEDAMELDHTDTMARKHGGDRVAATDRCMRTVVSRSIMRSTAPSWGGGRSGLRVDIPGR
jgi:hypothetical protein